MKKDLFVLIQRLYALQNHRIAEVERNLHIPSSPSLCSKQGQVEQAAQECTQFLITNNGDCTASLCKLF